MKNLVHHPVSSKNNLKLTSVCDAIISKIGMNDNETTGLKRLIMHGRKKIKVRKLAG